MSSELGFLIDLLLNHKLTKATKDLVAERVKEVERGMSLRPGVPIMPIPGLPPHAGQQAPSMQAIMARNPDLIPEPVAVTAHTVETKAALVSREQAIADRAMGKVDPLTGRPRKF